jgi:phosphoglycolate phosphatase
MHGLGVRHTWGVETERIDGAKTAAPVGLAESLASAKVVLLDFDGPMCRLFAGYPVPTIAAEVKSLARRETSLLPGEGGLLPPAIEASEDPHGILLELGRWLQAQGYRGRLLRDLDRVVTRHELAAVPKAEATAGSRRLLTSLRKQGKRLGVASNNSPESVLEYLKREGLGGLVDGGVVGRDPFDPLLMKPHPHCLDEACKQMGVEPRECLFIGDACTDVLAAKAAGDGIGMPCIGFAKSADRGRQLRGAGAAYVVGSLDEIINAVHEMGS